MIFKNNTLFLVAKSVNEASLLKSESKNTRSSTLYNTPITLGSIGPFLSPGTLVFKYGSNFSYLNLKHKYMSPVRLWPPHGYRTCAEHFQEIVELSLVSSERPIDTLGSLQYCVQRFNGKNYLSYKLSDEIEESIRIYISILTASSSQE